MFAPVLLAQSAATYWHVLPLVLVISLVYSATRHDHWPAILAHALRFFLMVLGFMALVVGFLLVAPLIPWFVWIAVLIVVVALTLLGYYRSHEARLRQDGEQRETRSKT